MGNTLTFSTGMPTINYNYIFSIIILLIICYVIVYPVLGFGSIESILAYIILFLILYVIFSSMSNQNLYNELPSTIYPYNPTLGLDGISMTAYTAGLSTNNFIV